MGGSIHSLIRQMMSSVQLISHVQICDSVTATCHASLSITNSWSFLKLVSTESVVASSHLILCRPLLLLPSLFPSIRVFPMSQFFTSGGQIIGVSASASVLPMNIQDWFPLGLTGLISLQSQGLFKSLLQHHSSETSILQCIAFFGVQLSHPYMTTGKTIGLTRQTLLAKQCLCFLIDCQGIS